MKFYDFAVLGSGPYVDVLDDAEFLAEICAGTESDRLYFHYVEHYTYELAIVDKVPFDRIVKGEKLTLQTFTGFSTLCRFSVSTVQTSIQTISEKQRNQHCRNIEKRIWK